MKTKSEIEKMSQVVDIINCITPEVFAEKWYALSFQRLVNMTPEEIEECHKAYKSVGIDAYREILDKMKAVRVSTLLKESLAYHDAAPLVKVTVPDNMPTVTYEKLVEALESLAEINCINYEITEETENDE